MAHERDESEFNDVIAKLRRMDECFQQCSFAKHTKNLELWVQALSSLFSELITGMTDAEINQWYKELQKLIKSTQEFYKNYYEPGIPDNLYWRLFDFEIFTRRIYKKAGYEGKKREHAGRSLKA